jgi:hypothetical protein
MARRRGNDDEIPVASASFTQGAEDGVTPASMSEKVHEKLWAVRTELLQNVGHFPQRGDSESIARELLYSLTAKARRSRNFSSVCSFIYSTRRDHMFALLTILTFLIASMFVGLVATTMREIRQETVEMKVTAFRRNGH